MNVESGREVSNNFGEGSVSSWIDIHKKNQIEQVMLLEGFNTSEFCFGDEGCLPPFFLGGGRVFSNITPQEGGCICAYTYTYIYIYICTWWVCSNSFGDVLFSLGDIKHKPNSFDLWYLEFKHWNSELPWRFSDALRNTRKDEVRFFLV